MSARRNKKRKVNDDKKQSYKLSGGRRWEDLDTNMLREIFRHVSSHHLSCNVSSVCQSWRSVCWDLLFWGQSKLDLSSSVEGSDARPKTFKSKIAELGVIPKRSHAQFDNKMMELLKNIMEPSTDANGCPLERWRHAVRTVYVPVSHDIADDHLVYIAERIPSIERLELLGSVRITEKGFAMSCWKNLKYLVLGQVVFQTLVKIVKEIGKNSPELRVLNLNEHCLSFAWAYYVTKNLPQVRIMKFECSYLLRDGMNYLLTERHRHNLDEIHFCGCYLWKPHPIGVPICSVSFTIRFRGKEGERQWYFEASTSGVDPDFSSDLQDRFIEWWE